MYVEWKNKRSFQRKTLVACENEQQTQPTYDPRSRIQMVYTPKRNMLYPYTTKIIYKIPWNTQLFYCSLLNVHFYWEYLQRKSNLFQLLAATLIFVDQTLTDDHFNGSYTTFLWCLSFPFRNFVPLMVTGGNTCEVLYQENLHPQLLFVSLQNASPFSGQVWYSVKQSKKQRNREKTSSSPYTSKASASLTQKKICKEWFTSSINQQHP